MRGHVKRESSRAFTLVELLVVIAIVALGLGLTLSAGSALSTQARIQQTRTTLDIIQGSVDEWRTLAGRSLTWWQIGDDPQARPRTDIHADTQEVFIISEVLDVVARTSDVRALLAQVDEDSIYTYKAGQYPPWIDTPTERTQLDAQFDRSLTVLDAWGTPIYAIHPGRAWRHDDQYWNIPKDSDGTIRTYNEDKYGVAPNALLIFVSAGPDRLFGLDEEFSDLFGPERDNAKHAAQQDNIFSVNPKSLDP